MTRSHAFILQNPVRIPQSRKGQDSHNRTSQAFDKTKKNSGHENIHLNLFDTYTEYKIDFIFELYCYKVTCSCEVTECGMNSYKMKKNKTVQSN